MNLVIGSGPAAVSCTDAILKNGESVTMIDVGYRLEPQTQNRIDSIANQSPSDWTEMDRAAIKGELMPSRAGVEKKLIFGSEYPYRIPDADEEIQKNQVDVFASYSKGGFSNVWGAAVMPYRDGDIADWPIAQRDLAPHYSEVEKWLRIRRHDDDPLANEFPYFSNCNESALKVSSQSQQLIDNYKKYSNQLAQTGMYFGPARTAIGNECQYCGQCLFGCPYDQIFSAGEKIEEFLKLLDRFTYLPSILVKSIDEFESGVVVRGKNLENDSEFEINGKRCYLGAGALNSARIILHSEKIYDRKISLKYSEYFMFPIFQFRRTKSAMTEPSTALCQIFGEVFNRGISKYSVHLQFYSYNELFRQTFENSFGFIFKLFRPFFHYLLQHLVIVQGYMHSDDSSEMEISLVQVQSGHPELRVNGIRNPGVKSKVNKLISLFRLNSFRLGAIPLGFLKSVGPIGKGFHFGGSFPMTNDTPKHESGRFHGTDPTVEPPMYSDELGRPLGRKWTHLIDSSVFPSIPATTITFTVMANARRIGYESTKRGAV